MQTNINLLDVVALIEDVQEKKLQRGKVATVVEILDNRCYNEEKLTQSKIFYCLYDHRIFSFQNINRRMENKMSGI